MTSIQNYLKYEHTVCQNSNWIDCWCHGELKEMQRNDHILGPNLIALRQTFDTKLEKKPLKINRHLEL